MKLVLIKIRHPLHRKVMTRKVIRLETTEEEWIERVRESGLDNAIESYSVVEVNEPEFKPFPRRSSPTFENGHYLKAECDKD